MRSRLQAGASLGPQRVFRATSVDANISGSGVGDPYVDPLFVNGRGFNTRIDTNRYRILTFEFGVPDTPRRHSATDRLRASSGG